MNHVQAPARAAGPLLPQKPNRRQARATATVDTGPCSRHFKSRRRGLTGLNQDEARCRTLTRLQAAFPDRAIQADALSLIHAGRFANAHVFRYRAAGLDLIIKDFSHCPWWVRISAARLFVRREMRMIVRLQGLSGIASAPVRLGRLALAYAFIPGVTLSATAKSGDKLSRSFFERLEALVFRMHERGIVHLDLRNLSNILVGADGRPYLIDFQSAIDLRGLPKTLRTVLEAVDLSGIYKSYLRLCMEPLEDSRRQFLERFNRLRRVWVFKGYVLTRYFERLRGPAAR